MNKTNFLEGLKEALQGELNAVEVNNQLLYYERYIEDELKKGRTETAILEELGSPRLIARTIIETKGSNTAYGNTYYEDGELKENQGRSDKRKFKFQLNGTVAIIVVILLIILVISLIFSLVTALAPIIIPLLIIAFVISYLSKKS